jgi:hypothetical protein
VVQGSVVFSNEKLQAVPYAIFAQNGVPTGSIMPWIGTVVPWNWLLCDGSVFPDNNNTANLKALLGSTTTPNLRGMFLRGTGTAATGKAGPALKTVQQDDIASHLHGVNINTDTKGDHSHEQNISAEYNNGAAPGIRRDFSGDGTSYPYPQGTRTGTEGAHYHNVNGNTANTGTTETRPINYGVNYIIKI